MPSPRISSSLRVSLSGSSGVIEYFGSARKPLKSQNNMVECYLLMQYCPRGVIDCMNNGTLQINFVLQCMASMCVALGAMHNLDVPYIHRDIKVENILLDKENNFRLCDFGSATCKVALAGGTGPIAERTEYYTTSRADIEADIGKHTTPQYRSPEMVDLYSGQPISEKCDVWALGCALYKLLYGDTPFGDSTLSIISGQISFPPQTSATTTTPAQKDKLDQIIRLMLTSSPKTRPDIYTVSDRIHTLLGKSNPVQNTRLMKLVEMFPALDKNKLHLQLMLSRTLEDAMNALLKQSPQPSPNSLSVDRGAQRTQSERLQPLSQQQQQQSPQQQQRQNQQHMRTQSYVHTNNPSVHIQPHASPDAQNFRGAYPGPPRTGSPPVFSANLGASLSPGPNYTNHYNHNNNSATNVDNHFSYNAGETARMSHNRTRSTPMARAYDMGSLGAALPQHGPYSPQNDPSGSFARSPGALSPVPQYASMGGNMTIQTQPNLNLSGPNSPGAVSGPRTPTMNTGANFSVAGANPATPSGTRERPRAKHRVSNTVDFRSADFQSMPANDPFAPPGLDTTQSNISTQPMHSATYDPFAPQ